MSIVLYEHNKKAYQAVRSMLETVGKAAVIHPTGTGKSFIGFKLCEDNPDKTICWLSPSQYIFTTQMENLRHESSDYDGGNIAFYTYAKLMNMSEGEMLDIKPDYIILDEFHRCGAVEWGAGVNTLIDMYPDTPILGLSATAIRYLDAQRDMAAELFDSNIASEMSLGEAIVKGILNPPKYVLSIFSYKEEINRYEKRLRKVRNKAARDKAEEILEKLRRAIDKAEGLDSIFNKHITDRTGRYIIFCANYEAMLDAMDKVGEWFHLIDEKPYIYHVYSDDASTSKSFKEFKTNDDNTHLKLLFCIDALNEGVHVEGVSGVILLRPTVSPIIYKQQIGRALSASKTTKPVVFDIVNNIEGLYSIDSVREEMEAALKYMSNEGDSKDVINDSFEVIDEVRGCIELFDALEDTLTAGWDIMYLEAKGYYEEHGNLIVPATYETSEGYSLGRWIRTQRNSYESLSDDQVDKLNKIGMLWTSVIKDRWLTNYNYARRYFKEHGNLVVPYAYEITDDGANVKLGVWISSQRDSYAKGRLRDEQISMLEEIGMCWDRYDEKWEIGYSYARLFKEQKGDINFVPADYNIDGFNLGRWLNSQRTNYRNNKLSDKRIAKLNKLGFKWSAHEAFWDKGYEYAASYKRIHGNLKMPVGYVCDDGFKLKSWLCNQVSRYKKGNLSEGQVSKLQSIGAIH